MNAQSVCGIVALLAVLGGKSADAQKLTEQYIPIGKSPGLSGKVTSVGTIDAVDMKRKTLTYTDPLGTVTLNIDSKTRIWLDRSKQQLTNIEGSLGNCAKGQIIEVKFRNNERRTGALADWIKLEVKSP